MVCDEKMYQTNGPAPESDRLRRVFELHSQHENVGSTLT